MNRNFFWISRESQYEVPKHDFWSCISNVILKHKSSQGLAKYQARRIRINCKFWFSRQYIMYFIVQLNLFSRVVDSLSKTHNILLCENSSIFLQYALNRGQLLTFFPQKNEKTIHRIVWIVLLSLDLILLENTL